MNRLELSNGNDCEKSLFAISRERLLSAVCKQSWSKAAQFGGVYEMVNPICSNESFEQMGLINSFMTVIMWI